MRKCVCVREGVRVYTCECVKGCVCACVSASVCVLRVCGGGGGGACETVCVRVHEYVCRCV